MVNFNKIFGRPFPNKTILIGEGSSGKTCLIHRMINNEFVNTTPTTGKKTMEITIGGKKVVIHDIGGQSQYQKIREKELTNKTENILLVIDATDRERLESLKNELDLYFDYINKKNIKVIVVFTKVDLILDTIEKLKKANEILAPIEKEFSEKLNLHRLNNFTTCFISAKTEFGIFNLYNKFNNIINNNIEEKIGFKIIDFQVYKENVPLRKEVNKIFSVESISQLINKFIQEKAEIKMINLENTNHIIAVFKGCKDFYIAGFCNSKSIDNTLFILEDINESILKIKGDQEIEYYLESYATNVGGQ